MKNPSVVINGEVFIAGNPKLKLWREIAEFKKIMRRQSEELLEQWNKVGVLREKNDASSELGKMLSDIGVQMEQMGEDRIAGKLKIIESTFDSGLPIDELPLDVVPALYDEIDKWVHDLLAGKMAELPNAEAPTAE